MVQQDIPVRTWRLLGTGSRDLKDQPLVDTVMDWYLHQLPVGSTLVVIQSGEKFGADKCLRRWVKAQHPGYTVQLESYPADWNRECDNNCRHEDREVGEGCKAAGPLAKERMIASGADVCIGFPEDATSGGAWSCLKAARKAGIRCLWVDSKTYDVHPLRSNQRPHE